ncbi:MAG: DUF6364 family protein [Armatimonadota bacterium]
MLTKLTLRIDDRLIHRAKAHTRRTGRSVSQLVADYFAVLDTPIEDEVENLPPITRELCGLLAGADVDEEDYRRYLIEKYGK